jgi:hypothetical protein
MVEVKIKIDDDEVYNALMDLDGDLFTKKPFNEKISTKLISEETGEVKYYTFIYDVYMTYKNVTIIKI